MTRPLKVSALANGAIAVDKTLTIDCPMIPALEAWLNAIVEPDAQARFGQKVATVNVFGAYSCRRSTTSPGARLSEHAFGNAVDIAGFTLADGRDDRLRPRLEEDGQPGSGLPARGPCGRLPVFHDRARAGRRRLPLQPHPPRSRQSWLDRHRSPALSASRRLRQTSCRRPRPPTACRPRPRSRSRSTSRISARRAAALRLQPTLPPDRAKPRTPLVPPAPMGESDPAPPILPAGAGPSIDPSPTSSIRDQDN